LDCESVGLAVVAVVAAAAMFCALALGSKTMLRVGNDVMTVVVRC